MQGGRKVTKLHLFVKRRKWRGKVLLTCIFVAFNLIISLDLVGENLLQLFKTSRNN